MPSRSSSVKAHVKHAMEQGFFSCSATPVLQMAEYMPCNHDDKSLARLLTNYICLLYEYLLMTGPLMIADQQVLYNY
jgi:hypothetical protein